MAASLNELIRKYESYLKEDKYDELFSKITNVDDKNILLDFLLNKCNIDVLSHMTEIPRNFFTQVDIKKLYIPDTITEIGDYAFSCCTLEEIYMSDSVISIGQSIFNQCQYLNKVRLSKSLTTIPKNTFYYCTSLDKVFIPDSVMYISEKAFENCANNLIIICNKRDADNKLQVPKSEIDFYKEHLKFRK